MFYLIALSIGTLAVYQVKSCTVSRLFCLNYNV
nr:MAG TPA: hypothetical protein [Caudoviricetes sp.]